MVIHVRQGKGGRDRALASDGLLEDSSDVGVSVV